MSDKPWYDKSNEEASDKPPFFRAQMAKFLSREVIFDRINELLIAYDAKCASLEESQAMIEKFKAYNRNLWESFLREQKKLHGT